MSDSKSSSSGRVIGIRRETFNSWERRTPFSPKHVREIVRKRGYPVIIQPSARRAYPIQEYVAAGAESRDDLSGADVIMSVKSVTVDELIPDKTYVFFSHTIKAQKDNMPLLDAILKKNITMMDYEKMGDMSGPRPIAFGNVGMSLWAGHVGMIDILHGMGLRLLGLGHHTPFLHVALAHNYRNSHLAVNALRDCGYDISLGHMPESLGPLIFVFTGAGYVSEGAQQMFRHLPHEYVTVDQLSEVAKNGRVDRVYGCVVDMWDHLVRREGGAFDEKEYFAHPERYDSTFAKKVAPYASVILNCIFWAPNHPRLLTTADTKQILSAKPKAQPDKPGQPTLPHRLIAICDISADPGGSIEFMKVCTTIDRPFIMYDVDTDASSFDISMDAPKGVLVCSVDNMPAQMPFEATDHIGDLLMNYIDEIVKLDPSVEFDKLDVSPVIKNAVITHRGKLTPNYAYIDDLRKKSS